MSSSAALEAEPAFVEPGLSSFCQIMTLEDTAACDNPDMMHPAVAAVEEVLVAAQRRGSLTVGVYESAKLMNVDPDSVILCLLAADPEDEDDIALNIHFTLIQAFCCDNEINIVRLSGLQRLSEIVGGQTEPGAEPRDLHCILVTNPHAEPWTCSSLEAISNYCTESRCRNQWVPFLTLTNDEKPSTLT